MSSQRQNRGISTRQLAIFAMLATLMIVSKKLMELLPNIHLIGVLTVAYTTVYRKKALIPIYLYVFLEGLFAGFSMWWIPYLYIWTILWGFAMLLPKKLSERAAYIVYPVVCALHGVLFGVLYAPAQALLWGLKFEEMIAWILSGLTFDFIHAVGNFVAGFLVIPIVNLLRKLERGTA